MNPIPIANARKIISKYTLKFPGQYTLEEILNAERLYLCEANLDGIAAAIVFNGNHGIITVDSKITDAGRKNFTIAHEFGHYCNEKISFQACKEGDILSISISNEKEVNANLFAAELLMPGVWLKNFIRGRKLTADTVKAIARQFSVSISAAAVRLTQLDLYPCAIAMTGNGKVIWSSASDSFKFKFIPRGKTISTLSYVNDFYKEKFFEPREEKILVSAWFDEDFNFKDKNEMLTEIIIPFPNFNSALSLLC